MHDPVEQPAQCENPRNDVESVQTGHEIVDAEKDPQVASRIDGINLFLVDHSRGGADNVLSVLLHLFYNKFRTRNKRWINERDLRKFSKTNLFN